MGFSECLGRPEKRRRREPTGAAKVKKTIERDVNSTRDRETNKTERKKKVSEGVPWIQRQKGIEKFNALKRGQINPKEEKMANSSSPEKGPAAGLPHEMWLTKRRRKKAKRRNMRGGISNKKSEYEEKICALSYTNLQEAVDRTAAWDHIKEKWGEGNRAGHLHRSV